MSSPAQLNWLKWLNWLNLGLLSSSVVFLGCRVASDSLLPLGLPSIEVSNRSSRFWAYIPAARFCTDAGLNASKWKRWTSPV